MNILLFNYNGDEWNSFGVDFGVIAPFEAALVFGLTTPNRCQRLQR